METGRTRQPLREAPSRRRWAITDRGSPPADTGQWGETKITADGTNQYFGIPSAAQDWSVKQGWMTGLRPGSTYNSTGYVDGNRYAVVILTYGSISQYGQDMSDTITEMAKVAMPGGVFGPSTSACPA